MARKSKKSESAKSETETGNNKPTEEAIVVAGPTLEDAQGDDKADASTDKTEDSSEDSVEVSSVEDGADPVEASDDADKTDDPAGDAPSEDGAIVPADGDTVDAVVAGEVTDASAGADSTEDTATDTAADTGPAPVPVTSQIVEKRGPGFVPLVLGGLVAGGIGWAIATYATPPAPAVDAGRLDALEAQIAELSAIEQAQSDLAEQIAALDTRVAALEAQPATPATSGADAATVDLSGLEAQIGSVADEVSSLQPLSELEPRVAALESEVAALANRADSTVDEAEAAARRAAVNQIRIALDSGLPFADPLEVLGGDAPDALASTAAEGVPTAQDLQDSFPGVARAALSAARAVEPQEGNPITAFLRRQTGARSLEPQEGNSSDAVLSRAEAAVRDGDLSTALSELEALPPEAQTELADWVAQAQTRAAALSAAEDYLSAE